jgi:hypothetical protein
VLWALCAGVFLRRAMLLLWYNNLLCDSSITLMLCFQLHVFYFADSQKKDDVIYQHFPRWMLFKTPFLSFFGVQIAQHQIIDDCPLLKLLATS